VVKSRSVFLHIQRNILEDLTTKNKKRSNWGIKFVIQKKNVEKHKETNQTKQAIRKNGNGRYSRTE
jgi:hypothetical protein